MTTGHAFLAPSSAHRWVRCALSPRLEAAYPETEPSTSSLEGTAAHWVVQMLLQGTPAALGMQAPNGVAVTQDMLEGAALVVADIEASLGPEWRSVLVIEQRVNIPRVSPHNWGTPDYRAWTTLTNGRRLLRIWDYKYGHKIVEAFENWQLIDYAAGCLDEAGIDGLQEQETLVEMCVIQPRAFHKDGPIRSRRYLASDLRAQINRLCNQAEKACSANPEAVPSPDACEHCQGRHACEALMRESFAAADRAYQCGALELSPHAMGLELRMLKRAQSLMEARVTGLEAQVAATIKSGRLVPFWLFESSPGRLKWNKPIPEILTFGEILGLDLKKATDAITPTQAKALAKAKGLPENLFASYSETPAGAVKLVADDGSKAALIFGQT